MERCLSPCKMVSELQCWRNSCQNISSSSMSYSCNFSVGLDFFFFKIKNLTENCGITRNLSLDIRTCSHMCRTISIIVPLAMKKINKCLLVWEWLNCGIFIHPYDGWLRSYKKKEGVAFNCWKIKIQNSICFHWYGKKDKMDYMDITIDFFQ